MIIGVISDTHSLILPIKMLEALKHVDLIIHCGDLCDGQVLKQLQAITKVVAVQGNMDDGALKKKLSLKEKIDIEGVKIGIYHGHGMNRDALGNAAAQFAHEPVDLILFGHSHKPFLEKQGNVTFFNPGSPNDSVRAPYFSYGLIDIKQGKFKASIVKL